MQVPLRVVDAFLDRMEGAGDYQKLGKDSWRCTECGTVTGNIDVPGERMVHAKDCAVLILEEYAKRIAPRRAKARHDRDVRAAERMERDSCPEPGCEKERNHKRKRGVDCGAASYG